MLTVDGQQYEGSPSSDHPTIEPNVGAGGGESTGVLEFPDAPTDATSYELHIRGSSESTSVGDERPRGLGHHPRIDGPPRAPCRF